VTVEGPSPSGRLDDEATVDGGCCWVNLETDDGGDVDYDNGEAYLDHRPCGLATYATFPDCSAIELEHAQIGEQYTELRHARRTWGGRMLFGAGVS